MKRDAFIPLLGSWIQPYSHSMCSFCIWKYVVSPFSLCLLPPAKVSSDWTRPRMTRTRQPMAGRETKSSVQDQLLRRSRRRTRRQNLNVPSRVVSRGEETQTRTFGRTFSRPDSRENFRLAVLLWNNVRQGCGMRTRICVRVFKWQFFLVNNLF
jgi:hypothetical protein